MKTNIDVLRELDELVEAARLLGGDANAKPASVKQEVSFGPV